MVKTKLTVISNFIFLGFIHYPKAESPIFELHWLMYLVALLGNIILISITILDSRLHTPMYFFLSNLSFLDIWYTSAALTPMLANFVSGKNTISFPGCASQMHFSLAMGSTECVLLSMMAYDRYVHQQPLEVPHYHEQEGLCVSCSRLLGDRLPHHPGGNNVCAASASLWK